MRETAAVRLVLLDRDGVLNEDRPDYVKSPDELVLIPGAAGAVARLTAADVRVVVCTNQSAVGQGLIDIGTLDAIHAKLRREIEAAGGRIDDILYAPAPRGSDHPWRKPNPGMLAAALARYAADPAATPMIGDSLRDMQAALQVGCRRVLVRTGHGRKTEADPALKDVVPVTVHDDLASAVNALLGDGPCRRRRA